MYCVHTNPSHTRTVQYAIDKSVTRIHRKGPSPRGHIVGTENHRQVTHAAGCVLPEKRMGVVNVRVCMYGHKQRARITGMNARPAANFAVWHILEIIQARELNRTERPVSTACLLVLVAIYIQTFTRRAVLQYTKMDGTVKSNDVVEHTVLLGKLAMMYAENDDLLQAFNAKYKMVSTIDHVQDWIEVGRDEVDAEQWDAARLSANNAYIIIRAMFTDPRMLELIPADRSRRSPLEQLQEIRDIFRNVGVTVQ